MSTKRFDLYGWRQIALVQAAERVTAAIGVDFEKHDSGYHGGDYYRTREAEGNEILIQANFVDEDGYLAEPDFSNHGTLVYVNGSNDEVTRILAGVEGLELLRTEEV